MSRVGTKKHPAIVRVQTIERAEQILAMCNAHRLHCIVGVEPDKPEDISDVDRALIADQPARTEVKPGRNEPCLCGSAKKYKKCCGGMKPMTTP